MWPFKKIEINTRDHREREISFLGITIIQYGCKGTNGVKESYLEIFPKSFEHIFLDRIIQTIGGKYDFVFLLRADGIGEAYLLCLLGDELVQKYKAKKPCIAFHRRVQGEVVRIFDKTSPLYYTESLTYHDYNRALVHSQVKYKGINFCVWPQTLHNSRKMNEGYCQSYKTPYPEHVRKKHTLKGWGKISPQLTEGNRSVSNHLQNFNMMDFVFIIAEANAEKSLPREFWIQLCDRLKQKDIDVFVNTKTGVSRYGKSAPINVSQAMYLASKSKAVIGIRCGFTELISSFPVQKHIIYTDYMWEPITAKKMVNAYSLSSYPGVDQRTLHEYAWEDDTDALINRIVETL